MLLLHLNIINCLCTHTSINVYWELCKLPHTPFYLLLQLAAAHVPVLVNSRCWTPARHHTASSQACLLWSMSFFFTWYSSSCIMKIRKQCRFNFSQCDDVLGNYIYIFAKPLWSFAPWISASFKQYVCTRFRISKYKQARNPCSTLIYCSTTVVLWRCCSSPYASYYYGFAVQSNKHSASMTCNR